MVLMLASRPIPHDRMRISTRLTIRPIQIDAEKNPIQSSAKLNWSPSVMLNCSCKQNNYTTHFFCKWKTSSGWICETCEIQHRTQKLSLRSTASVVWCLPAASWTAAVQHPVRLSVCAVEWDFDQRSDTTFRSGWVMLKSCTLIRSQRCYNQPRGRNCQKLMLPNTRCKQWL